MSGPVPIAFFGRREDAGPVVGPPFYDDFSNRPDGSFLYQSSPTWAGPEDPGFEEWDYRFSTTNGEEAATNLRIDTLRHPNPSLRIDKLTNDLQNAEWWLCGEAPAAPQDMRVTYKIQEMGNYVFCSAGVRLPHLNGVSVGISDGIWSAPGGGGFVRVRSASLTNFSIDLAADVGDEIRLTVTGTDPTITVLHENLTKGTSDSTVRDETRYRTGLGYGMAFAGRWDMQAWIDWAFWEAL